MALGVDPAGADGADHPGLPLAPSPDGEGLSDRAQGDAPRGLHPSRQPLSTRGALEQVPLSGHGVDGGPHLGLGEPGLVLVQGELGGGAGKVGPEDLEVCRVEDGVLGRLLEEDARVVDDVAVERVLPGNDQDDPRPAAPDATRPLARRENGARVSDEETDVESPDVDAELERGGGDDPGEVAAEKPLLDRTTLFGEKAAPVGRDLARELGGRLENPCVHELRDPTRLGERDRPEPSLDRVAKQAGRERVGRDVGPEERVVSHRLRGAVLVDHDGVAAHELAVEGSGVSDRRRARDHAWVGAVVPRDAQEPAEDLRRVRAEDPPIGVDLVEDDEFESREERVPAAVGRKEPRVQHVGRRDQHGRGGLSNAAAPVGRGVPVVDLDCRRSGGCQRREVGAEARELVALEGLEGKEEQGSRLRVLERARGDREVVDEALAARGRGRDDDVLPAPVRLERHRLMAVELPDAPAAEDRRELGGEIGRGFHRVLGGEGLDVNEATAQPVGGKPRQLVEELPSRGAAPGARRRRPSE